MKEKLENISFGFWVYIMSDCVLFASLFAAYAVLKSQTFGGPAGEDFFDLSFILIETLILLTSSFTMGLAILFATQTSDEAQSQHGDEGQQLPQAPVQAGSPAATAASSSFAQNSLNVSTFKSLNLNQKWWVLGALAVTLLLGWAFLGMELSEFGKLIAEGSGPSRSAFLSSFFTLVGTHGLHVFLGSIWMVVVMIHIYMRGVEKNLAKLTILSLFWHFLDVVWIFIYTFVYLLGLV